ncbi:RIP metalloprotease RseP [bacterium]|nr:MAG: RIP metalloprotease RseP [bacterium]
MSIFLVILLFSILVLAHEAGHFFSAKKVGVRVDEFGLGYPPRIVGIYRDKKIGKYKVLWGRKKNLLKIRGTIYSLNLIPFGGFVRIFGQDREDKSSLNKKDSFNSKSAFKRSIVILAGVAANVVLAMIFLSIVFLLGAPVEVNENTVGNLKDEYVVIMDTVKDSPADTMGLQTGDKIIKLEIKNKELNIKEETIIAEIDQVQEFINKHKGEEIFMTIQRGGEIIELKGIPRIDFPEGEGALGVSLIKTGIVSYPWYKAIGKGISYSFSMLIMIINGFYLVLKGLLFKSELIGNIAGPVGIFRMTSQAASLGFVYFLHFGALISLNLAVINTLPFPALDGGHFLFILIEKIKGSPIKAKTERIVNTVGFSLLIILMIFITVRDVVKLF